MCGFNTHIQGQQQFRLGVGDEHRLDRTLVVVAFLACSQSVAKYGETEQGLQIKQHVFKTRVST